MMYEFSDEIITHNDDLAKTVPFIQTEFEKSSKDKSFRNRLIEICETDKHVKTGHKKWLWISHFSYSYKINGVEGSFGYAKDIPSTVDDDHVSIVYDICVRLYGSLIVPIVQFSIPAQRSKMRFV